MSTHLFTIKRATDAATHLARRIPTQAVQPRWTLQLAVTAAAALLLLTCTAKPAHADAPTGSAIFFHPDGASAASWAAARALQVGPDGDLHWDRLPHLALYRGHLTNSLTGTSNGGATVHATGLKVTAAAFGRHDAGPDAKRLEDANGRSLSVARQALAAGLPVGVVQSGSAIEPGTAAFLTDADHRSHHDAIAVGLLDSGAHVILGGGERHFLPQGVEGTHGPGNRADERNLVELAKQRGYTVVTTRNELLALPDDTPKVLGLFASYHTFNDTTEEQLRAAKLPHYDPDAPTLAEMTAAALRILKHHAQHADHPHADRFFLVIEEEGPDNFGNNNNAAGMLEAMARADAAFGVLLDHLAQHPDTLLLTAADSDAGGMRLVGQRIDLDDHPAGLADGQTERVHPRDINGAPRDGVTGINGRHFLAAPDRNGVRLPFSIAWASKNDATGGVLVRAAGLNAHRVAGSMDSTDIAPLLRLTLFGSQTPPRINMP